MGGAVNAASSVALDPLGSAYVAGWTNATNFPTSNGAFQGSNASGYDFHPEFDRQIDYIRRTPAVRDVLLSGGDPLLLNDAKLEHLLSQLRAIPHVEFLRLGTRIPIFLPQRITPALCATIFLNHTVR